MFDRARRSTKTPLTTALLAVATRFALRAKTSAHAFADRRGLNAWFTGGVGPEQISSEALKVYREIAQNALNDPTKASPTAIAEQSRRLELIEEEL